MSTRGRYKPFLQSARRFGWSTASITALKTTVPCFSIAANFCFALLHLYCQNGDHFSSRYVAAALVACNYCFKSMVAQGRHSHRQKETARKCGLTLGNKARLLGLKANIRTLVLYEDPTHGVWRITKHCPADGFPDLNALVEEFDRTGKAPCARPSGVMPCNRNLRRQPRERVFAAGEHAAYLRLSCETSEDDETALLISSSASESGNSDVETVEHLAGSDDLAAQGSGSERSWPYGTEDNTIDRLIELQLEETCAQACQRLLRYVDCENVDGMKNCSSKIL